MGISLLNRALHAIPIIHITMTNSINLDWLFYCLRMNNQVKHIDQTITLSTGKWYIVRNRCGLIVSHTIHWPCVGLTMANRFFSVDHNWCWHNYQIQTSYTITTIHIVKSCCSWYRWIIGSTIPCIAFAMADGDILYWWLYLWQYSQVQRHRCTTCIQTIGVGSTCTIGHTIPTVCFTIADGLIKYGILTLSQYYQFECGLVVTSISILQGDGIYTWLAISSTIPYYGITLTDSCEFGTILRCWQYGQVQGSYQTITLSASKWYFIYQSRYGMLIGHTINPSIGFTVANGFIGYLIQGLWQNSQAQGGYQTITLSTSKWYIVRNRCGLIVSYTINPGVGLTIADCLLGVLIQGCW